MADFLVVGGTIIPVAWPSGAPERDYEEIGDRGRADAGNLLTSIRARKFTQPVTTMPLSLSSKNTIRAILVGSPPITCSGELLGASFSCDIRLVGESVVTIANNARRYVLHFEILEI